MGRGVEGKGPPVKIGEEKDDGQSPLHSLHVSLLPPHYLYQVSGSTTVPPTYLDDLTPRLSQLKQLFLH